MKIIKIILALFAYLFVILLFSTVWNFDNSNAFEMIATFLSITIGFTITALSIIATSHFSKELYQTEDKKDNSKTLLHILVNLFKTSTLIFTFTIILILIYKFAGAAKVFQPIFSIKSYPITFLILLKSIIWSLTLVSFYFFLKLFETFSKFVIKTAARN